MADTGRQGSTWTNIISGVAVTVVGGVIVWWLTQSPPPPKQQPPASERQPIRVCERVVVGLATVRCELDIIGPGLLTIGVTPSLGRSPWRLGLKGLPAVTSNCTFKGDVGPPNPSLLAGKGEARLECPVQARVEAERHELSFEGLQDIANLALSIRIDYAN